MAAMASPTDTALYPVLLATPASIQEWPAREKGPFLSRHARSALILSDHLNRSAGPLHTSSSPIATRLSGGGALPKTPDGAPLPLAGLHWSLTHKPRYVGAVSAPFPVGIDVEALKPRHPGILDRIASREERERIASAPASPGVSDILDAMDPDLFLLFRLWTAKEAVLKAVGVGLAELSRCHLVAAPHALEVHLIHRDRPWRVAFHPFDGHLAAVAHELPKRLPLHWNVLHDDDVPAFARLDPFPRS